MKDYYKILNIEADANDEKINHAYNNSIKDENINEAFNILSNYKERQEYHRSIVRRAFDSVYYSFWRKKNKSAILNVNMPIRDKLIQYCLNSKTLFFSLINSFTENKHNMTLEICKKYIGNENYPLYSLCIIKEYFPNINVLQILDYKYIEEDVFKSLLYDEIRIDIERYRRLNMHYMENEIYDKFYNHICFPINDGFISNNKSKIKFKYLYQNINFRKEKYLVEKYKKNLLNEINNKELTNYLYDIKNIKGMFPEFDSIYQELTNLNENVIEKYKKDIFYDHLMEFRKIKISWCGNLNWNEELINRFIDLWNWNELSENKFIPWNEKIIDKFINKWNWEILCKNKSILWDYKTINKYSKYVNWCSLIENDKINWTKEIIELFIINGKFNTIAYSNMYFWDFVKIEDVVDLIDWRKLAESDISKFPWSLEILTKYEKQINFYKVEENSVYLVYSALSSKETIDWTEELIDTFLDKWCWYRLSENPTLPWSENFIKKYEKKLFHHYNCSDYLLENSKIAWTEEMIHKYRDYFNWDGTTNSRYERYNSSIISKMSKISINLETLKEKAPNNWLKAEYLYKGRFDGEYDFSCFSKNEHLTHEIIDYFYLNFDLDILLANEFLPWSFDFYEMIYRDYIFMRLDGYNDRYIPRSNIGIVSFNKGAWEKIFKHYIDDAFFDDVYKLKSEMENE